MRDAVVEVPFEGRKRLPRARLKRKTILHTTRVKKERTKPSVMRSLRTKLWELCKQITRAKYGGTCYTCGKTGLSGAKQQTGHFIPRSTAGLILRYELRNLRIQCYNCNINLGGNGSAFYHNLVRDEGQEYVDRLFSEKEIALKETKDFYFDRIAEYKAILANL